MPISPPSTVTSPTGKQNFSSLTPLPLSPPILKPSTKPPQSLDAPNPTTRANFSPTAASAGFGLFSEHSRLQSTVKPISHSASASISNSGPSQPQLKYRSPSLSQIHAYLASGSSSQAVGPPTIPLRISSIPANTKPRKLSLQHLRSNSNLKGDNDVERESFANYAQSVTTPSRSSPPLNTNKELPNPPGGERRAVSDPNKRKGSTGWQLDDHPGIAELPANSVRHSRQQSQPVQSTSDWGSYAHFYDKLQSSVPGARPAAETDSQPRLPPKSASRSTRQAHTKSEASPEERKSKELSNFESKKSNRAPTAGRQTAGKETAGKEIAGKETAGGRPAHMSRTQKDKDRKKRSKAKIITEHVDLIKDDFWEKRPWILSGKTG